MDLLALVDHVAEGLEDDTPFRAEIESLYLQYEGVAAACAEEVSGARDLLRDLRAAGMKLGIVTRNAPPGVKIILERVPLEHDVLLTRSDVPRVKPHPDHLLRAAALLDAPAVETLMVGDHRMDIQAGIAAGMPTVALLTEALGPEHFAALEPACTFDTLAELRAWLLR
jgi:phosphoglycolate phosphatase